MARIMLPRNAFNVAIDNGLVALNPARGGPGLKAFKEQRRTRYLELSEVGTLISAMCFRVMTERATLLHSGT